MWPVASTCANLTPCAQFIMAEIDYAAPPTHPISKRTDGTSSVYHKPHANEEEYKKLYAESIGEKTAMGFWDRVSRIPNGFVFPPPPETAPSRSKLPRAVPVTVQGSSMLTGYLHSSRRALQ